MSAKSLSSKSSDPVLKVENVELGYGELKVVFGVSLFVGQHELVGLVGGNGSGKFYHSGVPFRG